MLIVREVNEIVAVFAVVVKPLGQGGVDALVDIDVGVVDDDVLAVVGDRAIEQADLLDLKGVVLEQGGERRHLLFALSRKDGDLGFVLGGDVHDRGHHRLFDVLFGDDGGAVVVILLLVIGEHIGEVYGTVEVAAYDQSHMVLCPVDLRIR